MKVRQHGIIGVSSNYPLYGAMSNRMVSILRLYSPRVEVYSIDESILALEDWTVYGPTGPQWVSTYERETKVGWGCRYRQAAIVGNRVNACAPVKLLLASKWPRFNRHVCCLFAGLRCGGTSWRHGPGVGRGNDYFWATVADCKVNSR